MNRKYAGIIALSMLVLTAAIVAVDALVEHMTDTPDKFDSVETIPLTKEITMPWRMGADEKYVLKRYSELTEEAAADHVILTNENYGGMYYDDDGKAVICVKTDSPSDTYSELIDVDGLNKIAIREVKYSKAELTAALDAVTALMSDYDSWQMRESGLSQRHNCIEIGLAECGDLEAFAARLLTELGLPESSRDMFDIYIYDSADDVYYIDKTT